MGGGCLSFECPCCHAKLLVAVEPEPERAPRSELDRFADVIGDFPEELQLVLDFEDLGDYVKITPQQYLGSEVFSRVGAVVRELGGEYHSEGKTSHFTVKKKVE